MKHSWHNSYPKGTPYEINPDSYKNIPEVLDESVQKFKDHPCFTNFGYTLNYSEIDNLSKQFASFLQSQGLKKGDRIALQMPNILQYPVALYGALRAGLIVVNTNPLYTAREMEYQFNDSGVTAIVICSNFASQLEKILQNTSIKLIVTTELFDLHPQPKRFLMNAAIKYLKKMVPPFKLPNAISFRKALEIGKKKSFSPVAIQSSDLAFLQYTGGTTGVSKGAMLTHRNIVANMEQVCAWMQIGLIEKEEVCIMPLPMYHVFSLTVNALSFFKFGTQNILVTNPRDIPALIKLLKNSKFSIMTGVNTLYNAMLNHADFKGINFTNLKLCVAGAMALQKSVAEKWLQETKTPIVEGYGLTETSPVVCCNAPTGEYRLGTIGMPVPSTEVKILKEDGSEAKIDEPGMLCVKGPQVMKGYWEKEDETKNVFTSDGWLKTGDIASVSKDGFFTIQDREKDMIIVSGFKVFPNEVEGVLATHPKILEAGVIGVEDPHSGEVVKAFIVKKVEDLTEKEVIEHCKKNLTNYKIPKYITFVPSLPKTNVGKVLRKDLRKAA